MARPPGLQLETLQALALVTAFEAAAVIEAGFGPGEDVQVAAKARRQFRLIRLADALASAAGGAEPLEAESAIGLSIDRGRSIVLAERLKELRLKLTDEF